MIGILIFLLIIAFISSVIAESNNNNPVESRNDKNCPPHSWDLAQINIQNGDDTYYMQCKRCKRRPFDA